MTVSERRATYPLQRRLKIYSPDTMARQLNQEKAQKKLVVNGVNILNKSDILNGLINELAQAIPSNASSETEKCHRAQVLRQAIDYIHSIQRENETMRAQL
ncbi:hypothetical protein K492DRAFT_119757, partial [Lichtheimia hyalospora FSU 10163]